MTSQEPECETTPEAQPPTPMATLAEALADAEHARQALERVMPELFAVRDSSTGPRKHLAVAVIAHATIGRKQLEEITTRLEAAKTLHRSCISPRPTEDTSVLVTG